MDTSKCASILRRMVEELQPLTRTPLRPDPDPARESQISAAECWCRILTQFAEEIESREDLQGESELDRVGSQLFRAWEVFRTFILMKRLLAKRPSLQRPD